MNNLTIGDRGDLRADLVGADSAAVVVLPGGGELVEAQMSKAHVQDSSAAPPAVGRRSHNSAMMGGAEDADGERAMEAQVADVRECAEAWAARRCIFRAEPSVRYPES